MNSDRRGFFRTLAAVGSAATFSAGAHGDQQSKAVIPQTNIVDANSVEFWTQHFVRPPSGTLGSEENADARTPRFFIYTPKEGFRFAGSPKTEELEKLDRPSVKLRVKSFKPSDQDSHKFESSQSGTLRVDLLEQGMVNSGQAASPNIGQTPNVGNGTVMDAQTAPKATTAISALAVSGQAQLQPSSVKGLSIGDEEAVPLPDGTGYLNWTFFLQKREASWHQILAALIKYSSAAATSLAPILNLAALPKNAWTGFNTMMGALLPAPTSTQNAAKSTTWLFNPAMVSVVASQKAYENPAFADGLPLIKYAYYIVVPQENYEAFGAVMSDMKLDQNYIVPTATPPQSVFTAALKEPKLKNITYLIFQCEDITEAPVGCSSGTKVPQA